jgi:hypothetical protein
LVVRNDRKGRLVQDPASRAWLSSEDAEAVDRGLAAHDPARRGIGLKVVASMPMALDEISHIFSTAELLTAYGLRAHERVVYGEAGSGTVAPLEMTNTPNTDSGPFDAAVGADTAVSIHASSSTLCSLIAGLIVLGMLAASLIGIILVPAIFYAVETLSGAVVGSGPALSTGRPAPTLGD